MFFMRRVAFVLSALLMREFLLGQLAMLSYTSITMCFLLQWFKPLESRFANNIETFNEVTVLALVCLLFCFSDFMTDAEIRSDIGIVYICISLGNIAVHLLVLMKGQSHAILRSCKRRCLRMKARKLHQKYAVEQKYVNAAVRADQAEQA